MMTMMAAIALFRFVLFQVDYLFEKGIVVGTSCEQSVGTNPDKFGKDCLIPVLFKSIIQGGRFFLK
jgi:hypothetical protein